MHQSITIDRIIEAVQADGNVGFCTNCGMQHSHCEPDARRYYCDSCEMLRVFGAEELLLMLTR